MPTIKDVAREAGVSTATVSYVMNNRHEMVSEQTRLHVLETASRMGYRANMIARNLQSSRTRLLGYGWHGNPADEPNVLMDKFIFCLAQAAEAHDYHLLTFTHPVRDPVAVYQDIIQSGRVDGFVLSGTQQDDPRIAYLIEQGFPFVSFGRANEQWEFPWIDTDGEAGLHLAAQHLMALGHTRIAFLGWPLDSLSGNHRLAGYRRAMAEASLNIPDYFIIHDDYTSDVLEQTFSRWQALPPDERPTALLAVADYVAAAAMHTAGRFGYTVGKDLSIIGFDDAPFSRYLNPDLTTLAQPLTDIAETLVRTIDALVNGHQAAEVGRLFVPNLIVRGSSGAPHTV